MSGKSLKILIFICILLSIAVSCGETDKEKRNYTVCRQRIIDFSKTMDPISASYSEELKTKVKEICGIYGFRRIDEFGAAKDKYENELKTAEQGDELLNILKQVTSGPTTVDGETSPVGKSQRKAKDVSPGTFQRAVSLKVLQQKLKEHHGKPLPQTISQFCGINEITGYLVDNVNRDIILVGEVDDSLPPIYLEDFVIALRNTWLKYARLEGNTRYYSSPGCTIDPDPKVLKKLDDVKRQINNSQTTGAIEKAIEKWKSICKAPQKVGVFGIPFNTRFARVMVKADYDMKRLVDGSDLVNVPGFTSLTDMELEQVKKDILSEKPLSVQLSGLNRFWFHPGENRYLEDENIVVIDQCKVVLLTEAEHLAKSGEVVGTGHSSPYTRMFTENFSNLYSQITEQRPIYRELENLFRFVALAKILKFRSPHTEIGLNIDYLLNEYPVSSTPVERYLPGRSNVKGFTHRKEHERGYHTYQLWLPSCGGVSIDIDVDRDDITTVQRNDLENLKEIVFKKRPSSDALAWDLQDVQKQKSTASPVTPREIRRLNEINRANIDVAATFIVEEHDSNYKVYYDSTEPIYEGPNKFQLLKRVTEQLSIESTLCFDLKGFKEKSAESFTETMQVLKEALKLEPFLLSALRKKNSAEARDKLNSPNMDLKLSGSEPELERVTDGKFTGWFRGVFNFSAPGKKIKTFAMRVYSKSKEFLLALFRKIKEKRSAPHKTDPLLKDIIDAVNELEKNRGNKDKIEIIIEFLEQITGIDISFLNPLHMEKAGVIEAAT